MARSSSSSIQEDSARGSLYRSHGSAGPPPRNSRARPVPALGRQFVIEGEILGRSRTPDVKRVRRRVIAGLPVMIDRDVVDVGGILRVASPRIAHVMKVIGAEHVA